MEQKSRFGKLKGLFSRVSAEEAEDLIRHVSTAWKRKDLVPEKEGFILLDIERIKPPKRPVREKLGNLEELKRSIKEAKLAQPIMVRPLDKDWEEFSIIVGLRRYHAYKELGYEEIPAFITELESEEALILAMAENTVRKDLTQSEMLRGILRMRKEGYTLEKISDITGKSVPDISVYCQIPKMPGEVREAFEKEEISLGHIKVIKSLETKETLAILDEIRKRNLSVNLTRQLISIRQGKETLEILRKPEIKELLGSKIFLQTGAEKSSLTITFSGEDELQEILEKLT